VRQPPNCLATTIARPARVSNEFGGPRIANRTQIIGSENNEKRKVEISQENLNLFSYEFWQYVTIASAFFDLKQNLHAFDRSNARSRNAASRSTSDQILERWI
jgi:hypothetical protein